MQKIAFFVSAALLGAGAYAPAQASSLGWPCTSSPKAQWLSLNDLKA